MKPHFLSSLICVLLVILLIPGMTPHMASAAYEISVDSGSSSSGNSSPVDSITEGDNTGTDSGTETVTETETDSGTETVTETETDSGTETVTETETDSGTETVTETETDSGTSSGKDTGKDKEKDKEKDSGTETVTETETKSGTETVTETGTETVTDTGTNSETGTGTNAGTDDSKTGDSVDSKSPSSGSSSNSDSGSNNMGSGISTEPATNIEIKELATRNVISGYHIIYDFPENVTCITHIEYDAIRTFRKTTATVEVLKNKSVLVKKLPAGRVYKHVNIWIGENAAGLPTSIKNGSVGFKVEKEWIENNNVNESLITLQWYNMGNWKPLDTEKVGEDKNYVYFNSKAPGYSTFAITEYTGEEKEEETQLQKTLRDLTGSGQNGIAKEPMRIAKILLAVSLPLFMVIAGYFVLKKKI